MGVDMDMGLQLSSDARTRSLPSSAVSKPSLPTPTCSAIVFFATRCVSAVTMRSGPSSPAYSEPCTVVHRSTKTVTAAADARAQPPAGLIALSARSASIRNLERSGRTIVETKPEKTLSM